MTLKIQETFFSKSFADLFASGQGEFNGLSQYFLTQIKRSYKDDVAGTQRIEIGREILRTAAKGQKIYYQTSLCGRIEKLLEDIFEKIFGIRSNYRIVKENSKSWENPSDDVIHQSHLLMTSYFGLNKGSYFVARPQNGTWIGSPNGLVYEMKKSIAHGSFRSCHPSTRHGKMQPKGLKTLEVAVITANLPAKDKVLSSRDVDRLETVTTKMKDEYELLGNFEGTPGIVQAHDFFTDTVDECDLGFTIMDYHENGNLKKFMGSDVFKGFDSQQKKLLIAELLKTFFKIHQRGYIHRDVKCENIVIGKDFKPIAIDFEQCILKTDEQAKEGLCSTVLYWPPEYKNAYLQACMGRLFQRDQTIAISTLSCHYENQRIHYDQIVKYMPAATTQAMDTWALGLVFFEIAFGEELINCLGFPSHGSITYYSNLHTTQYLHNALLQLPAFIAAMESPSSSMPEQWRSIKEKIQKDLELWNQIIKPMLSVDPEKRLKLTEVYQTATTILGQ